MPIYEYDCGECGKVSEILVRSDSAVACRHCGSERVTKKLSAFAFSTAPRSSAPACAPACGGGFQQGMCGSGGCCGGGSR